MEAREVDESAAVERARPRRAEQTMRARGTWGGVASAGGWRSAVLRSLLWEWLTVSTRRAKDGGQCARVALTSTSSRAEGGVSYLCGFGGADRRRSGTVISGGAVRACKAGRVKEVDVRGGSRTT